MVFWMTYAPLLSKLRDRVSERLSKLIAAMMIAIGIRDDPRVDLIAQTRSRLVFTHPV